MKDIDEELKIQIVKFADDIKLRSPEDLRQGQDDIDQIQS